MEYLISLEELDSSEDNLFKGLSTFNLDSIVVCPICNMRSLYKDWWCCKQCSKLPLKEFNKHLFKHFKISDN